MNLSNKRPKSSKKDIESQIRKAPASNKKEETISALTLSDQLSRSILEHAGEAIIVCDENARILRVSRAALTFTKTDPLHGNFCTVFPIKKESTGEDFSIEPALKGVPILQTEVVLESGPSEVCHFLASVSPLPLSDYSCGCVVVMTDITERKKAEEERERVLRRLLEISTRAQQQAAELEAVFSSLAEPVVIFDEKGIIVRVNRAGGQLLGLDSVGLTLEELATKTDLRLADRSKPTVDALVSVHALSGETVTSIEYSLVNAHGERRTVTSSASPIRSGGKITGAVVVFHDITERRWAEDALKRSERRFRNLSETSTFGLIISDLQGKLNYANPSILDMLGYEREDLSGPKSLINWEELSPDEYKHRDRQAQKELQRKGRCIPYEKELIRKNQTRIPVLVGSSVIEQTKDGKKEVASFITDLSALKQAEHELKSIEWLLTRNIQATGKSSFDRQNTFSSNFNTSGEIGKSVGKEVLLDIVGDCVDLLGTSAGVHECDGTCAFAICSSEWCGYLNVMGTNAPENSDKKNDPQINYCMKNCWKRPAKTAMREGKPIDFRGRDGLSVYAVPITLTDGNTVGALHFCYGEPPREQKLLEMIAQRHNIPFSELRKRAASYEKRPPFIIDIAKARLESSARLIAVMIERKKARSELQRAHDEMELRVEQRTAELTRSNMRLQKEIDERLKTQETLSQRQLALESVYSIATTFGNNLTDVQDQVVLTLAEILDVRFVAADYIDQDNTCRGAYCLEGELDHYDTVLLDGYPRHAVYKEQMICQFHGEQLNKIRFNHRLNFTRSFKTFLGVPIRESNGESTGAIYLLEKNERYFSEYEVHLVEIYARYIGHEIKRTRLEQQLLQSQQMKLLGQIATGVAHEVRNPLNAILAISEALFEDMDDNAEYQPYVEHIRKQVTKLSALMRDLLDLGRPQRHFDFKKQALGPAIFEAISEWKQNYNSTKSELRVQIPREADGWYANIDKSRMKQVIINLLENSCDYSVAGAPVCIETAAQQSDRIIIRIVDRGEGIAQEHLERLFQPFFTTRTGGTGLGLSVAKHILEMHGGGISILNNNPPPGTTAELWLPLL